MAVLRRTTELVSPQASDFTGLWRYVKGESGAPFSALAEPTGSSPTLTIDCQNSYSPNRRLTLAGTSSANANLALTNVIDGCAGRLHVLNNDTVAHTLTIPGADVMLNGTTAAQTVITCRPGGWTVIGWEFNGSKVIWSYLD